VTRVLLVTGKGGVGKTTTAAATAARCARMGHRTLVVSTDPAHSLGDALGTELEDRPVDLGGNLWAQELDARVRLEEQWGELRGYLAELLDWAGAHRVEAEELTVLPGLEEILALTDLVELAEAGEWDVLVVDCAPTAETLRLLSLPQVLGWWMDRLFPLGRQVARLAAPLARQFGNVPVAGDPVFGAAERLYGRLAAVRDLLADHDRSSVRLVVTPEQVVVAEARRTATYLSLYGFSVDAVVVNRLLPDDVTDPWFDQWKAAHARQLRSIEEGFAPVPVLRSVLQPSEPVGRRRLETFARTLYGRRDPSSRLHDGGVFSVTEDAGATHLRLELPFSTSDEVSVTRRGAELFVTIGPYRRAVLLPDALARRAVLDAEVDGRSLTVTFAP
jgi:arsenite/tail-anchored protein-transporting ATPase